MLALVSTVAAIVVSLAAALGTHIDSQMSQIIQNQNEILRDLVVLAIKCGVKPEDMGKR